MIAFRRLLQIPGNLRSIIHDLNIQHAFLKNEIKPVTDLHLQHSDGTLDDADIKKIFNYYGIAVPSILGEAFCMLHGRKMNEAERICSTSMGAMTGLFDDFLDKQFMDEKEIETSVLCEGTTEGNSNEQLFNVFYKKALDHAPDPRLVVARLLKVHQAQLKSKLQVNGNLSKAELISITLEKGSTSLLFYYTAFQPDPNAKENQLIGELGGWMQLANDIFDVYKDREANIQTLVTSATEISELSQLFLNGVRDCYRKAGSLGLPKNNQDGFLNRLSIGIFSRCLVCLDQLTENQRSTNNLFDVHQYSRKQLICDMDTTKNKMKSLVKHLEI